MDLTMNQALSGIQRPGIRRFTEMVRGIPGALLLTIGEPDLDTPPAVRQAAKNALDAGDTHYPPSSGRPALLEAISQFEAAHNGLHYDPDEIILTVGATEAVFASLFAILNPGDEVIIPTPAFGLYESIAQLCRAVPVALPSAGSRFQIDPEALARAITPKTKALVLTSPNNPTGCIYTKETLDAIHNVLRDLPIFVLCDEVYRQLIYTDSFHSFGEYPDMRDRVIIIQSFSKPYAMTGWRVGYLMADKAVRDRIQIAHQYAVVSVPSFVQPACLEALAYDTAGDAALFRRRRDFVYDRLRQMGLEVEKPDGAFYLFISIQQFGMDSLTFCTRMAQEGKVGLVPGIYFGCEGYMRLSYCYSDADLAEGLRRIETFIRSLS